MMRRLVRPLLYLGTVGIVVGLGRYHAEFIGHYTFHTSQRLPWSLVYAVVLCLVAYGLGLPDLDTNRSPWGIALLASGVGAAVISVIQLVLGSLLLPRFVVFCGAVLTVPWFVLCVGLADIGRSRLQSRDRVVLVAGPDEQSALELEMWGELERPAVLATVLTPEQAQSMHPTSKPLVEAVLAHRGTMVVLDRAGMADASVVSQAATLHEAGLRVRSLSVFYDEWLGKLPLTELERMSLMFDVGELHRVQYGRLKRLFDVLVAAVGLVVLAIVTPFVCLGNLVANRGPLLYRQERVGRNSRSFEMLKFRTMRDSGSSDWTAQDDARVTAFGSVLRRTHLDELPQVVNILKGHLSIVGPRPEQVPYVRELRDKLQFYDLRHIVRPGLTGWAQVKFRYGSSEVDALEKLQYEFYYLRHQGLALDLRVVGRTLRTVIGHSGR
jgi:lipopolysaccharide/colanic/teichoic acid biosynthesis glycosyltransferase